MMVTGKTRKTTGTSIAISLRPPASSRARRPISRTSVAWARRTSASGVPRSTAIAMPSTKRAKRRQRGARRHPLERGHDGCTGAGIGKSAAELARELAVRQAYHPFQRADRTFTGTDRESQQLGNGRELRDHRGLAASDLAGQRAVSEQDAGKRQHRGRGSRNPIGLVPRAASRGEHGEQQPGEQPGRSPQHLLDAELLDRHRRGRSGRAGVAPTPFRR